MKLHEQVKQYKHMLDITIESIEEIRSYLNSSKFSQDISVNKNDILLRLNELDNNLFVEEIKLN
jgi:hypothetical protein